MADKVLHMHDSLLGWVPRPGAQGTVSDGAPVTIDGDGLRITGDAPSAESANLAVGDSFTWDEDVGDLDAWPARLQKMSGWRVLNGGVTGYGFDQIVLRAERLVERFKPAAVIVSFIPDDIGRTEMRRLWWYDKPWFEIEHGELMLKGVPVPNRTVLPLRVRHRIERVIFEFPPLLQHVVGYHARKHKVGAGPPIARRLVERLARLEAQSQVRVVVVAQYDPRTWMSRALADKQRHLAQAILECAADNGMATVDTFSRLAAEPRPLELYNSVHLNPRGNQMIASLLAATLPGLLVR